MMHSVTNKTCSETIMPPFLLILNPLRDKKCVMMLCSIEIESLRDIIFPVKGININRIQNIPHFRITLTEGLILIHTRKMFGMRKR